MTRSFKLNAQKLTVTGSSGRNSSRPWSSPSGTSSFLIALNRLVGNQHCFIGNTDRQPDSDEEAGLEQSVRIGENATHSGGACAGDDAIIDKVDDTDALGNLIIART